MAKATGKATTTRKRMTLAQAAAQIESLRARLEQSERTNQALRVRLDTALSAARREHQNQNQNGNQNRFVPGALSERAREYCRIHGVGSVSRETLMAWRP